MTPENIYTHRKNMKMKRAEFARELGLAPRTLKAYEEGTSRIPRYIALAIQAVALKEVCQTLKKFSEIKVGL